MADYHTVYKRQEGESTQWEDIHRKLGNLPPKEKPKPTPWTSTDVDDKPPRDKDWVDKKTEEELEDLEDDLDDDRFLADYRAKRLAELKQAAKIKKYGSVELIRGSDFVREVSQAGEGVWVVVHLFKDSVQACELLGKCLDELAEKYPATKFVKIVSTDCIPRYPDANLPTILLYYNGSVKGNIVGLHRFGGSRVTPEEVAFGLMQAGVNLSTGTDGDGSSSSDAMAEKLRRDLVNRLVVKYEEYDGSDED